MSISFRATYDGETLRAGATLNDLSNRFELYELAPDEELRVTFRDRSTALVLGDELDQYAAQIEVDSAPLEETIKFTLDRADERIAATSTFPEPFELQAPVSSKASEELVFTWPRSALDETMEWNVFDECTAVSRDGLLRGDPGTLVFPPNMFGACDVLTFELARRRTFMPNTSAREVSATAFQARHANVELLP